MSRSEAFDDGTGRFRDPRFSHNRQSDPTPPPFDSYTEQFGVDRAHLDHPVAYQNGVEEAQEYADQGMGPEEIREMADGGDWEEPHPLREEVRPKGWNDAVVRGMYDHADEMERRSER